MNDDYKRMLQKARKDLEAALHEREVLDIRIAALKQTIAGLIPLSGEPPEIFEDVVDAFIEESGITNGIRRVLSKATAPMSAPEIRDALLKKTEFKPIIEGYANPLSVIHNTLTRLIKQEEIVQLDNKFSLKRENSQKKGG